MAAITPTMPTALFDMFQIDHLITRHEYEIAEIREQLATMVRDYPHIEASDHLGHLHDVAEDDESGCEAGQHGHPYLEEDEWARVQARAEVLAETGHDLSGSQNERCWAVALREWWECRCDVYGPGRG